MEVLFSQVLNMSLTASVVILCVMAARLLLKKAPKIFSYALWAVVLFRLLCPVSLTAPVSVLEVTSPQVTDTEGVSIVYYEPVGSALEEISWQDAPVQPEPVSVEKLEHRQADTAPAVMDIVSAVWLAGVGIMALYSAAVYLNLRRNLVGAMPWRGNAYLADHIDSPFVLGILRPRIYLPSDTPVTERRYIIAHERHHIRRCDHIVKMLAYCALCLHWFNPLVWAAFILAGKDMEMSCDEAVIRKLGSHIRADYSASLLRLATHRRLIAGTPLAFGEGDTKGRVMNMAKWKKPKVWVSVLCLVLCVAVVAVCALNPESEESIADMTRTTNDGPTGSAYGDLHYTLPGGITHEMREAEGVDYEKGQENRNHYNPFWSLNGVEFGGIVDYILPEGAYITGSDWIHSLDLWEWEDETLGYSGGGSISSVYELEFFTDVPPGTEVEQVNRKHYFFYSDYGNRVYDIWFDMTVADPALVEEIVSSASVGHDGVYKGSLEYPEAQRIGAFQLTVPEGCGYDRKGDSELSILTSSSWYGDTILGGVTVRPLPNLVLEETDMIKWVKATGVTWDEKRVSLAVTDETEYGDISLSLDDLKDGKPVFDTMHYFYIHGGVVYDLWFDELYIDEKVEQAILDSVVLAEVTQGEDVVTAIDVSHELAKQQALESCRSVLQMVQNSEAYQIETHRVNGYGALNPTSTFTEWGYIDNRLTFNRIPESGGESMFGSLIWEGVHYECDSQAEWVEGDQFAVPDPWLVSYQWNEENVVYVDTLTDDEGTTIMLRINEENPDMADSDPQYFVNFRFTPDGMFRDVTVQCNLYQSDAMLETESIVTLDENMVLEQIQTEASRATGKALAEQPQEAPSLAWTKEEALEKCKAVLSAVQSGSCHIVIDQSSTGAPVSHWSTSNYYQHDGNWLKIVDVDPETENIVDGEQYSLRMAFMVANGVRYSNEGLWGKAYTDIEWAANQTFDDSLRSWLASFQWNEDTVSYMDMGTERDSTNTVVMLRINEPYPGLEEYTESYFVNFFFDQNGSFEKLTIHADHFRGESMYYLRSTESIASLEEAAAAAQINKEYQRAIG